MSERIAWHDAKSVPAPPKGPLLWIYLEAMMGDGVVEMATWGDSGWRSAFNSDISYHPDGVLAWALLDYPDRPIRRWFDPDAPDPS